MKPTPSREILRKYAPEPKPTDMCDCTAATAVKPFGKVTHQFPYHNAEGIRLFSRFRYEIKADEAHSDGDKTFRYCPHYDRTNPEHVALPYGLPRLLKGIAEGKTIHLVEGETDCWALWLFDEYATTTHLGTRFLTETAQYFRGALQTPTRVLIWADRDHLDPDHKARFEHEDESKRKDYPGAASALRRRRALTGVGLRKVFFREAAVGKDARAHLATGRTVDSARKVDLEDVKARAPKEAKSRKSGTIQLSVSDRPEGPGMARFVAALEAKGYLLERIGQTRYKTNCPHPDHTDSNPSFEFEQGEKGVVATCESGDCTVGDGMKEICEDLGIKVKDLFDDRRSKGSAPTKPDDDDAYCPGPGDPMEVARYIQSEWMHGDEIGLMQYNGETWRYTGAHWDAYSDELLRDDLYNRMDSEYTLQLITEDGASVWKPVRWAPAPAKIGALMQAVKAVNSRPEMPRMNTWLAGPEIAGQVIPMSNGLYSVAKCEIIDHTPRYFNTWSVPFEYDPAAECPEWLKFLDSVFGEDADSITALQMFMGDVLSGSTVHHKGLLLYGPTRAGKGLVLWVMEQLMGGEAATAALTLRGITKEFGLQAVVGKPLTVIPDSKPGSLRRDEMKAAVEKLLSLIANDIMEINRKNQKQISIRPNTKVMLATNDLHDFDDASGAVVERWIVLRFIESFLGREDKELQNKLRKELAGIFNWALRGLALLNEAGAILQPASGQEVKEDMQEASPHEEFVELFMQIQGEGDEEFRTDPDDLRNRWMDYCVAQNIKHGDLRRLAMQQLRPIIQRKGGRFERKREPDGDRKRYYAGARFIPNESGAQVKSNNGTRMFTAKEKV